MIVYDSRGQEVRLDEPLARGGEAIVYPVQGQPAYLAKLYVPAPRAGYDKKLAWMKAHPPSLPPRYEQHLLVAWPLDTLHNRSGRIVGYLMPRVREAVPLLQVYSPRLREKTLPGFDEKYRYRAAQHLAQLLSLVHKQGYVVGDLNESNILVTPRALVTLIDVDSFQVRRREGQKEILHSCPVGKAEYLPPELQRCSLEDVVRRREQDCFALAVLIFKLLMDGRHPFQSRWMGSSEPPVLEDKIARGWYPYEAPADAPVAPPPHMPSVDVLHPQLVALLHRCFVEGHRYPRARPSAAEWLAGLQAAERALGECQNGHYFSSHLSRCPRCGAGRAVLPRWLVGLAAVLGRGLVRGMALAFRYARRIRLPRGSVLAAWWPRVSAVRQWEPGWIAGAPLIGGLVAVMALFVARGLGLFPELYGIPLWVGMSISFGAGAVAVGQLLRAMPSFPRLSWLRMKQALVISLTGATISLGFAGSSGPGVVESTMQAPVRRARVVDVAPMRLNVRAAPGTTAAIIADLPEGAEVELYELQFEVDALWQRVRSGAVDGWVSREYLREVRNDER
jgi:hypothetical protein